MPMAPAGSRAATILIVEDDIATRVCLADFLSGEGYAVSTVGDCAEAMQLLDRGRATGRNLPRLIILDMLFPELSGLVLLDYLTELGIDVPVLAISASQKMLTYAAAAGVQALLEKPFDLDQLVAVVTRWCEAPHDVA